MLLRIATVEAGDKPEWGVTFLQPALILNDMYTKPHLERDTALNIAIRYFIKFDAISGFFTYPLLL